jgi:hypothetical protein
VNNKSLVYCTFFLSLLCLPCAIVTGLGSSRKLTGIFNLFRILASQFFRFDVSPGVWCRQRRGVRAT